MTRDDSEEKRRVIGPYRIIKKLDAGGMGVVFKACREGSTDEVALKALPPKLAAEPERLARFRREVLACSRLDHPNLIRVLESGFDRGVHFFTMEFFPGLSLKKMVKRDGPFPSERVLGVARQIASACQYYHDKGLVHRDIKPANILLNDDGDVRIIDFGLAKVRDLSTMTRVDQALGTARYMPPEILTGRPVDRRSDIYQVGLVLHDLLTGEPVFTGAEPMVAVRSYVFGGAPLSSLNFKITDPAWAAIVSRCVAVDPALRYDGAGELAADLDRLAAGEALSPAPRRPPQPTPPPSPSVTPQGFSAVPGRGPEVRRERTARLPASNGRTGPSLLRWLPALVVTCVVVLAAVLLLTRQARILDIRFEAGIEEAQVHWKTSRPVPSVVEYSRLDDTEFRQVEVAGETDDHQVTLQGLEPGQRYRVHLVLPGGKRSPQFAFSTRSPVFSAVKVTFDGAGAATVSFTTDVGLICDLVYRSEGGTSRVAETGGPRREHSVVLPAFDRRLRRNEHLQLLYRMSETGTRHEGTLTLSAESP